MAEPRRHRRYTRAEKARAVGQATATSTKAAADKLGIPERTLGYWMDSPEFAELRTKTRDQVADEMWAAIQVGVREVAKGLSTDAPLRDKATAVGILYDKHALLTGMATSRSESRDLTGSLDDSAIADAIRTAEAIARGTDGRAAAEAEDPPAG